MSEARCPACGGESPLRLARNGYRIHRCAACDFEFVHPTPRTDELAKVYAAGYFDGGGHGYRDYFGAERDVTDAKCVVRANELIAAGARASGRWLDIGCADGRFLLEADRRGADAFGVEISPEARARLPERLRERVFASVDAARANGPFDVVTLWDVLEHLPDAFDLLRTLPTMLAPSAFVGIVVPVIDNVNARYWPTSWDQYKPPEHLWFFSRRALRAAMARDVGLRVVHESSAWRREARVSEMERAIVKVAPRRLERWAFRTLERLGALGSATLDDAVLTIGRRD